MADLATTFPNRIEIGAIRREEWDTQITVRDDGVERRNARWETPLRSYEISLPIMVRTDADYIALRALYAEAEGMRYSFEFPDWSDEEMVEVRFDTPLQIVGRTPLHDHIDTFTLVEVRDYATEGPGPVPPAPEWIAAGATVFQTSASLALAYPAGLAADDIAIAQVTVFDAVTGGTGWNTPGGWTALDNGYVNNDTRFNQALFWKRLTGAESGTQTFTTAVGGGGASDSVSGKMSIFRGVRATGSPWEFTNKSAAGNDITPNAPSVNTFGENRLIANFRAFVFPGAPFNAGIDYSEHYDVSSTTGVDTGLYLTSRAVELPQTYTGEAASIGSNSIMEQGTISVVLRP